MSFLYGTKLAASQCKERVLVAEPAKVVFSETDTDAAKSLNWFFARRVNLLVTPDALLIGKRTIDRNTVTAVYYYEFIANIVFMKYLVLKIKLKDGSNIYVGCDKNEELVEELSAIRATPKKEYLSYYFFLAAFLVMVLYYFIK